MPSINSINYCPNCGSKRIQNANFCMECGYKLKLLEEILVKQDSINNFNEKEKVNNILDNTDNTSENLKKDNKTSDTINQDVINKDFEVFRPKTEEINENEDKKTEIEFNVTNNSNNENNNFNLVRPNSKNNIVKKPKVKKNFSILNQKKI